MNEHTTNELPNPVYQNIHTHEVLACVLIETVPNYPDPVTVYVLSNGNRWCAQEFFAHWRLVEEKGLTP